MREDEVRVLRVRCHAPNGALRPTVCCFVAARRLRPRGCACLFVCSVADAARAGAHALFRCSAAEAVISTNLGG